MADDSVLAWLADFKKDIKDDFQGVHDRLDTLNGQTRSNTVDIAILKERSVSDPAARWSSFGAIVASAGAAIYSWFHK